MIMFILGIIIGLAISGILYFIIYRPRLKIYDRKNADLREEEQKLTLEIADLNRKAWEISQEVDNYQQQKFELSVIIGSCESRRESLLQHIKDLEEQAQLAANVIYEKAMEQMSYNIEQSAEKLGREYDQAQEEYKQEYLQLISDFTEDIDKELQEKKEKLAAVKATLDEFSEKVRAAVDANKRAIEIAEQADFYRLVLSQEDINEIKKLREIIPYLKDQEALNKVIWKIYYEKPTTDLIGRIIGADRKTGIYKITSITDQKCYVGQAVDLAARWKQHIKRGLGAEPATRNKLYPAMMKLGVENFSFEIIEECDSSLLDEREDFWQEYFHARDFGYSIK